MTQIILRLHMDIFIEYTETIGPGVVSLLSSCYSFQATSGECKSKRIRAVNELLLGEQRMSRCGVCWVVGSASERISIKTSTVRDPP